MLESGDVAITAGGATITPSTDRPAALLSKMAVDLIDAASTIEVIAYPEPNDMIHGNFSLRASPQDELGFRFTGASLAAFVRTTGSAEMLRMIDVDQDLHRHLRIRHQDDLVFFEASADGTSYAEIANFPAPSYLSAMFTIASAKRLNVAAQVGAYVELSALNERVGPAAWCPGSSLSDSFNAGQTLEWETRSSGTRCSQLGVGQGFAVLDQDNGGEPTACMFATTKAFHLNGSSVMIEFNNEKSGTCRGQLCPNWQDRLRGQQPSLLAN